MEQKIEIDGSTFSLTWHIGPTAQLDYREVIGMYIIEQTRLNFDKKDVEFDKYEANALFMQVSELSNKNEVGLNHVRDTQIRVTGGNACIQSREDRIVGRLYESPSWLMTPTESEKA